MKMCPKCMREQPAEEWTPSGTKCRPCVRAYNKEYRERDLEKARRKCRDSYQANLQARREYDLVRRTGLSLEQYNELLDIQGGVCALCGEEQTDQRLSVDHNHACCPELPSCGECVRALLCRLCNVFLGAAKEDPRRLRAAAAYLEAWS